MDIEHSDDHITAENSGSNLVRASEVLPSAIPLLALDSRPFFPGQVVPLLVDIDLWGNTIKVVHESEHGVLGLVLVKPDSLDNISHSDFHNMGTACRIHRVTEIDGKLQVMLEGLQRFSISEWISTEPPYSARVRYYPETSQEGANEVKAYAVAIINTIKELLPLNPLYAEEFKIFLDRFHPNEPSYLADFAASLTTAGKNELQEILEARQMLPRLEKVLLLINKELELARAQAEIRKHVEDKMHAQQREHFLREQLLAIQKELGISKDDRTAELDNFRERSSKLILPEEAGKRLNEELHKLSILETGSPEYAVTRSYLDWLTSLPWGLYTQDKIDLNMAAKILDRDHDGLEDIKQRILEFMAVGKMRGEVSGSILLFVGPPGVGKTSLGRSIANALGRKFYRFSLGGMRDEAEIKGHRRTYIGAMPGKFIQAIKETAYANPVIMLDEIDKVGASYHGDPASALLEVLDPEQNVDFLDHYMDVRFDLSKVLFICTANQLDTIPGPLLDRMEVVQLSGYITSEKVEIARNHLLPRLIKRAGLKRGQLRIDKLALRKIVEDYAREAGVRRLEKHLGKIVRKAVVKLLEDANTPVKVGKSDIETYLGPPLFQEDTRMSGIGVITGLAWTAMGGATLNIEASRVHEFSRGFKLTGQLGDVMKESAEIAYSYIVANADDFGAKDDFFAKAFLHLHVPAGATPKDGPSAGITMASALLSLASGRKPRRRIAMTGELTLTGHVLAVGGVREKVIAAKRAGISTLILPDACRGEYGEVPEHIRKGLQAHFVSHYTDVIPLVFGGG